MNTNVIYFICSFFKEFFVNFIEIFVFFGIFKVIHKTLDFSSDVHLLIKDLMLTFRHQVLHFLKVLNGKTLSPKCFIDGIDNMAEMDCLLFAFSVSILKDRLRS